MPEEKIEDTGLLDDQFLIKYVQTNITKLEFLGKDSKSKIKELNDKIDTVDNKSLNNKDLVKLIVPTWGNLLQDAIHTLKHNDFREQIHWKEYNSNAARDINNQFVFGIDKLCSYFIKFSEFEKILYGADGRYRDHVVHVFRVWLVGMYLLLKDNAIDKLEIDVPFKDGHYYNRKEIMAMWSIIALCHDLGYPLEKTEKINDSVEKMFEELGKISIQKFAFSFQPEHQYINKFLLDFLSSKLIEIKLEDDEKEKERIKTVEKIKAIASEPEKYSQIDVGIKEDSNRTIAKLLGQKSFSTKIQAKYYLKYAKSLENYNHGIISCSILIKALIYFLESDYNMQENNHLSIEDARQFLIRREILRAIASHTCPEIYHLKVNTLSFLLILCDELQEWGRPRFEELQNNVSGIEYVKLSQYELNAVSYTIRYKGEINDKEFAEHKFQQWHKILRTAVDDLSRTFKMEVSLEFPRANYKFSYESGTLSVETNEGGGNWKVWPIYNFDKMVSSRKG